MQKKRKLNYGRHGEQTRCRRRPAHHVYMWCGAVWTLCGRIDELIACTAQLCLVTLSAIMFHILVLFLFSTSFFMYILKITHVPYTNVLVLSFSPYRATFSFVLSLLGLLGGGVTNNIRTATPHVSCLFASFVPLKLASETLLDQLVDVCS